MSAITPTFAGEIQLAGWSESHTSGCKVTFWLSSPDELEAFRALTVRKGNTAGHRFMAALVEIGEDELPVQPANIKSYPAKDIPSEKPKGGELARLAGIWCNDPVFWAWLSESRSDNVFNAIGAAGWVRFLCRVKSRADLDNSPDAAKTFHNEIRLPFMAWQALQ